MMRRFKKSILLILALITVVGCGGIVGACADKEGVRVETIKNEITLNEKSFSLKIGETARLIPSYAFEENGVTPEFTSSDATIVSVDINGEIRGLKIGTAVITVKYGDASVTCNVTVGLKDEMPVLSTVVQGDSIHLPLGTDMPLLPYVRYNGVDYDDATITVTSSNPSVCSVGNGVLKTLAVGESEITVEADWRGITGTTLIQKFTVNVVNDVEFTINNGFGGVINLNTLESFCNEEFVTESDFNVTAKEIATNISLTPTIEIVEGQDIVAYENGKVSSKGKVGTAKIKVSCQDTGGRVYETYSIVNVKRSVVKYEDTVAFSAMHGTLDYQAMFGFSDLASITAAFSTTGEALTVENGNILGVATSSEGADKKTITVELDTSTGQAAFAVDVEAYTGILTTAEDLKAFNFANEDFTSKVWTTTIDGYYVLGNDIDCAGTEIYSHGKIDHKSETDYEAGFIGTFDGRGHTISNVTFSGANITDSTKQSNYTYTEYSLFGVLGKGTTVKDVAITNVKFDVATQFGNCTFADCSVLASYVEGSAKLQNIFIDVYGVTSCDNLSYFINRASLSGVANRIWQSASISDIVVDMTLGASTTVPTKVGALTANLWNSKLEKATNVVALSDKALQNGNTETIENVSVYETRADWAEVLNGNNPFEGKSYWKVMEGTPYWHTEKKQVSYKLYLDENKTALTAEDKQGIFGDSNAVITSASGLTAGYEISYTNGALNVAYTGSGTPYMGESIQIAFVTEAAECSVETILATKILTKAEDLRIFNFAGENYSSNVWNTTMSGLYVLGNDIDCTGVPIYSQGYITHEGNTDNPKGFMGTFDGRGYSIDNLTFSGSNISQGTNTDYQYASYSLFGVLGKGAVVKNVSITNVKFDAKTQTNAVRISCSVLASYVVTTATIENVYIDVFGITSHDNNAETFATYARMCGVADRIFQNATLKNVVVNMTLDESTVIPNQVGALTANLWNTKLAKASNIIVISDKPLQYGNAETIDGTEIYETEADLKTATTEGKTIEDYTAFIETGYWTWDSANGLKLKIAQ